MALNLLSGPMGVEDRQTRVHVLTRRELPLLADALVAYLRGRGKVTICDLSERRYVSLTGEGFHVNVLDRDWIKIMPSLVNGPLDTVLYPVSDEAQFRRRVLHTLQLLFV